MNLNLALAVLAGISIGAAGTVVIHVQQTKTPQPAYVIAEVEVTDRAAFQEYADKVAETMAPFEGHYHYVVRTSTAQALEGEPPKRIVVIAFDSAEKALGWYRSPAYQKIKPIRLGASVSRLYLAEGLQLP
jgi:uncharacterized protein (DUF1330 family)